MGEREEEVEEKLRKIEGLFFYSLLALFVIAKSGAVQSRTVLW